MARQTKTPKQRAEEALAVAERKLKKLSADELRLQQELDKTTVAVRDARLLRDYCKSHPALAPKPIITNHPSTTTQEEGKA